MQKANPIHWLLEEDDANPGVRYFALRDLLERPEADPEVLEARRSHYAQRTGACHPGGAGAVRRMG